MKKLLIVITTLTIALSALSCTEENIQPQAGEGGQTIPIDKF